MFYKKTKKEVVNLGTTDEHTVLEYARIIKKLINSQSEIICSDVLPEDDPKKRQPDITKAQRLLNWNPTVKLEEGFGKTIEYFKNI